jgi:hypothetical protein
MKTTARYPDNRIRRSRTKSVIRALVTCVTSFVAVTALSACERDSEIVSRHIAAAPDPTADDDIPQVVIVARRSPQT